MQVLHDDIIFDLQRFGGASSYWKNLLIQLHVNNRFEYHRVSRSKHWRFIPEVSSADIFHSSYFRWSTRRKVNSIITIHDLNYELGFMGNDARARLNIFERRRAIINADTIVFISESTRNDALDYYKDFLKYKALFTIPHGTRFPKIDGLRPVNMSLHHDDRPYFIFVGSRVSYKNFDLLLRAVSLSQYRKDFAILCTGAPFTHREIGLIHNLGLSKTVFSLGTISDQELAYLYRHAIGLLYPSSYEGFGLPVLDALSVGCPVICSNSSSLPEVGGTFANYFERDSLSELLFVLEEVLAGRSALLSQSSQLMEYISQRDWACVAKKYEDVYARVGQ